MSVADFRLVLPVPVTGPGSFSRPDPGTWWDRDGVLRTAGPNEPRVTYDPTDLSKPPVLMVEPTALNYIRNNTMQGGGAGAFPINWSGSLSSNGITVSVIGVGVENGIEYLELSYQGTATAAVNFFLNTESLTLIPASAGQTWVGSAFVRRVAGARPSTLRLATSGRTAGGLGSSDEAYANLDPTSAPLGAQRVFSGITIQSATTVTVGQFLQVGANSGELVNLTIRIGLPQLERDSLTSPIKRGPSDTGARAADVVGTTPGLLHSNVPITEPLWVAGTYAKDAKVRDAANLTYESLVDGNTAALTDKTKWLPLGATNRWKAFDKAVNSQTVGPGAITMVVKPGEIVNTLTLLNVTGATVSVTQTESGYSRTRSLVRHDVLSWYDWFYQEPIHTGDVVFDDVPPYPAASLTVTVDNGMADAALGLFNIGKARTIGKTSRDMSGGVLSYSTPTEDTFGNVRIEKRENAKNLNFNVFIPMGFENEAYRILKALTDVELVVIGSTEYAMSIAYGFLGDWNVFTSPGKPIPIEFRGLI